MFEVGEIVCHTNLKFNDNNYDPKENRPFIVLFTIQIFDDFLICTAPLTSSIRSFNKHPDKYYFLPNVIYNYRKLNFVNLENIAFRNINDTFSTGIHIPKNEVNSILKYFKNYLSQTANLKNKYAEIIDYIKYLELFDELEKKHDLKKTRNYKRKIAKRGVNP